jgi:hypothetical protein
MNLKRTLITIGILSTLVAGFSSGARCGADTASVPATARLIVTCDFDGCMVYLDGASAGSTPLTLDSVSCGRHSLLVRSKNPASWFRRSDSAKVLLMPGETRELKFSVLLPFTIEPGSQDRNSPIVLLENGTTGRTIGIWTSGGAAVVAGIAAAYFKIAADDRNETYIRTGNSGLLDERKRLDFAAGVALLATQLAFALFTYLLLSE